MRPRTLTQQCTVKAKFHYAILAANGLRLVADLQRAGIWPITH